MPPFFIVNPVGLSTENLFDKRKLALIDFGAGRFNFFEYSEVP